MDKFAAYNAARRRDRDGYAFKGYIIRECRADFDPLWTITKDGHHIGSGKTREEVEMAVRLLTD